jgi:hypothetical protein
MRGQEMLDPDRVAFVEQCAERARAFLATYETAPNLRVTDVRTLPSHHGYAVKLGLVFRQDPHPRETFGYWTFVWEQVAWTEKYRPPLITDDGRTGWVEEFIRAWDEAYEFRDAMTEPSEVDEAGVRWIRAALVWG